MTTGRWQRFTHQMVDDLETTILTDIANAPTNNLTFYVGADSQYKKGKIAYITAIVVLFDGKGGRGYYKRTIDRNAKYVSRKQRLFQETYDAVDVALWLNPILESVGYEVKEIHTDLNPNPIHASHDMIKQCIGYITGMGFVGKTKPDSFVAYEIADRFSK